MQMAHEFRDPVAPGEGRPAAATVSSAHQVGLAVRLATLVERRRIERGIPTETEPRENDGERVHREIPCNSQHDVEVVATLVQPADPLHHVTAEIRRCRRDMESRVGELLIRERHRAVMPSDLRVVIEEQTVAV